LSITDEDAISPQASIALHGAPEILSAIISLFFAYLFVKSPTFRSQLIELFTMAWAWAKATGERIEFQASGGVGMRMKQENARIASLGRFNQALSPNRKQNQGSPQSRFGAVKSWVRDTKDGVKADLKIPDRKFSTNNGESYSAVTGNEREMLYDAKTIERKGMYERAINGLKENEMDRDLSNKVQVVSIEAQESIMKFHENPTRENYKTAHDNLDLLEREMASSEGYNNQQKTRLSNVKREFYSLVKAH